ncbi:MAG: SRPBCC family protein [Gemmatimonadaceae bacterium]
MTTTTNALRVAQVIRADREKLFRAWTDPAEPVHWWRMEEKGWAFAGATIDLRVGGRYRLGMTSPEGKTHVAVGEYGVLDRPKRLAFTWDWAIRKARWVRRSSPWSSTMPVRVPPIARSRHAGDRRMTQAM